MQFVFKGVPNWPYLAWLARCETSSSSVTVFHGTRVEITDEWFCEAAWAGDYASGGFDETDIVAGSGARVRGKTIVFVSSGSIHDRLHSLQVEDGVWVSNSLCCLLVAVDASADLTYRKYTQHFASFRAGLDKYCRDLPTSTGTVQLTYFDNLVWDGRGLKQRSKPGGNLDFTTFSRYRSFLTSSMQRFADNLSDSERQHPYKMLCALSNGYDSPTVATLASQAGSVEAITFDVDRDGRDDSGKPIASILGVRCHSVPREAWRSTTLPEVPFIACSGSVGDVAFKGAEDHLDGKILFTGMTDAWDKRTKDRMSAGAGLGLTEYRLWAGFIHCPVALWGVRQLRDVKAISNSPEMRPWDYSSYSKPICRRIVEEAGVPRDLFGIGNRGVSHVPSIRRDFLSPSSREDFLDWLARRREESGNRVHTIPSPLIAKLIDGFCAPLTRLFYPLRDVRWLRQAARITIDTLSRPYYHNKYMVHWAIDRAKQRYYGPNDA